jgi:hypothetical protein
VLHDYAHPLAATREWEDLQHFERLLLAQGVFYYDVLHRSINEF